MKTFYAILISVFGGMLPTVLLAAPLQNPLGDADPRVLIGRVIYAAISLSGSIALLMFVYGGILWLTAMGRPEAIEKGKKILIWTTLGIVLIFSAYVLTTAVFSAILTGNASVGS